MTFCCKCAQLENLNPEVEKLIMNIGFKYWLNLILYTTINMQNLF